MENNSKKLSACEVLPKGYCTGCSTCVSLCPKSALSFSEDEFGYYVPKVDLNLCNRCGLCQKQCPALNLPKCKSLNNDRPDLLAVQISDKEILNKSSSGGVFSLLASRVLSQGGYVCGAAWTDDLRVKHIIVDKLEDLELLRKSKYLQSFINGVFPKIEQLLIQNKLVLFSGCPCQVSGLRAFLRKDYTNLITVDLLCSNAPSSKFFSMYIDEVYEHKPVKYDFRSKENGLWDHFVKVSFDDGSEIGLKKNIDSYQRAYHPHIMCPIHCEKCIYQSLPRVGDITIGDFWGIGKKNLSLAVKDGVSAVLLNNKKGELFFESINDEKLFAFKQRVPLEWLGGNGYALKGTHNYASPSRNRFYSSIESGSSFKEALDNALNGLRLDEFLESNHNNCVSIYKSDIRKDFVYDPNDWEEHHIYGDTYLFAKRSKSKSRKFAYKFLDTTLAKGTSYRMYIKFKVSTIARLVNFHVMDGVSKKYQVIHGHKVSNRDSEEYITKEIVFTADGNYDCFMIGASQIIGDDPWFAVVAIAVAKVGY